MYDDIYNKIQWDLTGRKNEWGLVTYNYFIPAFVYKKRSYYICIVYVFIPICWYPNMSLVYVAYHVYMYVCIYYLRLLKIYVTFKLWKHEVFYYELFYIQKRGIYKLGQTLWIQIMPKHSPKLRPSILFVLIIY